MRNLNDFLKKCDVSNSLLTISYQEEFCLDQISKQRNSWEFEIAHLTQMLYSMFSEKKSCANNSKLNFFLIFSAYCLPYPKREPLYYIDVRHNMQSYGKCGAFCLWSMVVGAAKPSRATPWMHLSNGKVIASLLSFFQLQMGLCLLKLFFTGFIGFPKCLWKKIETTLSHYSMSWGIYITAQL